MEHILWWHWLIFSGILLVFEMFTGTFAFLIISIGSLLAMILSLCGLNMTFQLIGLAVGALIMFLIVKSFPNLWASKSEEKFGSDNLIGKEAIVIESINEEKGLVKVNGQEWRAFANENIEKGEKIIIKEIKGVKLFVEKK